jgi:hypothetical protein
VTVAKVFIKPGTEFDVIAPGGYAILDALRDIAKFSEVDLVITSGTDGTHSGPTDPHKRGMAYDVRAHGLSLGQRAFVLSGLEMALGREQFYFFLEAEGEPNMHFHIQVAKGRTYTIEDLLAWKS